MNFDRSSGILLHPTSLPGKYGIGSLGKEAFAFIDFLAEAKQKLWQILPLGPTGYGDSPYQCFSAIAGNPILIDLDILLQDGWLKKSNLSNTPSFSDEQTDYPNVIEFKTKLLKTAFVTFNKTAGKEQVDDFLDFCSNNGEWLDDYSLFMSLKEKHNLSSWFEWEEEYRNRDSKSLSKFISGNKKEIEFQKFIQYLFFNQWLDVRKYANNKGIKIIGDIPIYISADSVETWTNSEIFLFDEKKNPIEVAGVPPDYFSETGQLWGNPIYNWEIHKKTDFAWWKQRIQANLKLYDIVRIDHFRGFSEFWAIPFGEETAINGKWKACPGKELFISLKNEFGDLPIIAEDLGLITDDVIDLRDSFSFPGMKILQFAFDSNEQNDYLPHTYEKNFAVYTGTHDNDTSLGWFESISEDDRKEVNDYLCKNGENICWAFIRLAHSSVANLSIIPLQDLMEKGTEGRMNIPGTTEGNWKWRFKKEELTSEISNKISHLTKIYGR